MKNKAYLQNYLRIEKEVIDFSYYITFDLFNLHTHSAYICDLILRCVSDIESISKDIYIECFDNNADRSRLKFDYDCINKMIEEWSLNERVLRIKEEYGLDEMSRIIRPFEKVNREGKNNFLWNFSYQALKHNKTESIQTFANLNYLFSTLAALYLLNLYYLDVQIETTIFGFMNNEIQKSINPSLFFTFPIYKNYESIDEFATIAIGIDVPKSAVYCVNANAEYLEKKAAYDKLDEEMKQLDLIKQQTARNELSATYKISLNKKTLN